MSEQALERFAMGVGWTIEWWHRKLAAHLKPAQIFGIFGDTKMERANGGFLLTFTEKHRFLSAIENQQLLEKVTGFKVELKFLKLKKHHHDKDSLQRDIVRAETRQNFKYRGVEKR